MAEEMGLSQNAIVRIWHAFGLQPHRVENFKFSKDPQPRTGSTDIENEDDDLPDTSAEQ